MTVSQLTKLQTCPAYNTLTRTALKTPLPTGVILLRHGSCIEHCFPLSPLVRVRNLLPSNGRCFQSHYLVTGLHAAVLLKRTVCLVVTSCSSESLTFRRNTPSPASGSKIKPSKKPTGSKWNDLSLPFDSAGFLHCLLVDIEDGIDMIPRNYGLLQTTQRCLFIVTGMMIIRAIVPVEISTDFMRLKVKLSLCLTN
jgi:hypothetical protein